MIKCNDWLATSCLKECCCYDCDLCDKCHESCSFFGKYSKEEALNNKCGEAIMRESGIRSLS